MIEAAIGQNLYNHGYKCHRRIGSGGFGNIYLVESVKYKELFVAKMIIIDETKPRADAAIEEVKMLMLINHPNIINMYETFFEPIENDVIAKMSLEKIGNQKNNPKEDKMDINEEKNQFLYKFVKKNENSHKALFIILEYCSGGSLRDFINKFERDQLGEINFQKHILNSQKLFSYTKQIALAIQKCHQNHIAHQDIKPENILFDRYGRVKLADFGLSHISNPNDDVTKRSGSPSYMAPELYKKESFDALKTDIWSFGITLYELAFGHTPFNPNDIHKVDNIFYGTIEYPLFIEGPASISFVKLLRKMLNPLPRRRYTIDQVLESEFFKEQSNSNFMNIPLVKRSSETPHLSTKMKMNPSYTTGIRCDEYSAKSSLSGINSNDESNDNGQTICSDPNSKMKNVGKSGDGQNPLAFQLKRPNKGKLNRRASLQSPPLTFTND